MGPILVRFGKENIFTAIIKEGSRQMPDNNLFVFRVASDNEYIKDELFNHGRLRQGWGSAGTNLLTMSKKEWIAAQCQRDVWEGNKRYYTQKYSSHKIMLEIKERDIIIIPKMPDSTKFTICFASGSYFFQQPDGYDKDDFCHVIPIDLKTVRIFDYHANEYCENIQAKMRAYQSPVNHVWNKLMRNISEKLISEPEGKTASASVLDIVGEIMKDCYEDINALQRIRNLGNRNTEKIVEGIFEKLGYEMIGKNSFDGNGGDADLIYISNSVSEFFEVSANSTKIESQKVYVQIKNKRGEDSNDTAGIEQLCRRTSEDLSSVKILISTADKFTTECQEAARKNNVLLVDGKGLLKLVIKYIV